MSLWPFRIVLNFLSLLRALQSVKSKQKCLLHFNLLIPVLTVIVTQIYNAEMKYILIPIFIALSSSHSFASQVAECQGEDISGNKSIAHVFLEDGKGRIVITTLSDNANVIETIESATKIKEIGNVLQIWDNIFAMHFSVSKEKPDFPVDAFRDGAFWITDFNCSRVD